MIVGVVGFFMLVFSFIWAFDSVLNHHVINEASYVSSSLLGSMVLGMFGLFFFVNGRSEPHYDLKVKKN